MCNYVPSLKLIYSHLKNGGWKSTFLGGKASWQVPSKWLKHIVLSMKPWMLAERKCRVNAKVEISNICPYMYNIQYRVMKCTLLGMSPYPMANRKLIFPVCLSNPKHLYESICFFLKETKPFVRHCWWRNYFIPWQTITTGSLIHPSTRFSWDSFVNFPKLFPRILIFHN